MVGGGQENAKGGYTILKLPWSHHEEKAETWNVAKGVDNKGQSESESDPQFHSGSGAKVHTSACEKTHTTQGTGMGGVWAVISQPKAMPESTQAIYLCG